MGFKKEDATSFNNKLCKEIGTLVQVKLNIIEDDQLF